MGSGYFFRGMKMADNHMKTAEFAEFCGTTKDTLFWYDKQGILKPEIVGENGYRYYTSRQFFDFATISTLKQTGNSLKEIAAFQREHNYETLQSLFSGKSQKLASQIQELIRMKQLVDAVQDSLSLAQRDSFLVPELIWQEAECLATTEIPQGYGWFEKDPEQYIYSHIRRYRDVDGVRQYPLGTMLSPASLRSNAPEEIAYFYRANATSQISLLEKPAGQYVRVLHRGSYGKITDALQTAAKFMDREVLQIAGPIYEFDDLTYLVEADAESVQTLLIPVQSL
jgi:DNA-binding transcriptional MerR regulator/effector-binding domain-containing protein